MDQIVVGSRILFQISTGYLELLSIGLLLHMVYLGGVGAGGGGAALPMIILD